MLKLPCIIRKERAIKLYPEASKDKDHKLSLLIPNILQTNLINLHAYLSKRKNVLLHAQPKL